MKVFETTLAVAALGATVVLAAPASAAIIITQSVGPAPTYSNTLTFDEVGAPSGLNIAAGAWSAYGATSIISGEGSNFVGDNSASTGGDTSNSFYGPFGVFMNFSQQMSAASLQMWDSSGPATFFGGGAAIAVLNNGVEVGSLFITNPAWGGASDSWFNITTTGGDTFDEIRALGFGFPADTIVDNISWNAAPAPGAFALLGLAGLVGGRRRRN